MSIDLFTAQEMIPSAEFSPDKQLKIYDVLRCIKYDTENKLFEPKTKLGDFFTEKQNKQKKIDLNVIKFKVQRLLRNAGFNDHGAFTGLWDRSLKLQKDDARKKIGMQQLPEITINGSKGNDMKFGSAGSDKGSTAPGKGSGAHGDSKYEKATYQLMDEGSIDETSDANYGKILDRMKKNKDAEKYNTIEDGSAGTLKGLAGVK